MITAQEYKRLLDEVETKRREAERAAGAYEQMQTALFRKHKVASIGEAKALLARLETEERKAAAAFDNELARFEDEWKEVLAREER